HAVDGPHEVHAGRQPTHGTTTAHDEGALVLADGDGGEVGAVDEARVLDGHVDDEDAGVVADHLDLGEGRPHDVATRGKSAHGHAVLDEDGALVERDIENVTHHGTPPSGRT